MRRWLLPFGNQFLAFFEIEFPRGEHGDGFDALDVFRYPQVWDTSFVKFFTELIKIDIYRAQQDERFAFGFVLHSHDCERPFISSR